MRFALRGQTLLSWLTVGCVAAIVGATSTRAANGQPQDEPAVESSQAAESDAPPALDSSDEPPAPDGEPVASDAPPMPVPDPSTDAPPADNASPQAESAKGPELAAKFHGAEVGKTKREELHAKWGTPASVEKVAGGGTVKGNASCNNAQGSAIGVTVVDVSLV